MTGKLEKMLILAFERENEVAAGNKDNAKSHFEALINPESYNIDYKIKTNEAQGHGTSAANTRYEFTKPEELSFEFLFDNTGIIDDKPRENVFDSVKNFRELLTGYQGSSHEPFHLKLVWGTLIFKGRATEVSINYKLFNANGEPIRAIVKVKFKGSIEEKLRIAKENKSSPDLTHERIIKAGDTLPLMCQRIYGEARRYVQVAEYNGLTNFRSLLPGQRLLFPPIEKTPQKTS